jgi:2-polyprenyl-3-methyl-5-hydroxy-6-metoxy-1,4-benzoquinol methylase
MCWNCDTQYADPMAGDEAIYNTIYEHPHAVRGYSRYMEMAELVLRKPDPLRFLAQLEQPYWFVADHLRCRNIPKSAAILEVGCGLGYLTYAMNRAGYVNTRGMDISEKSTEQAIRRYGPYYFADDLFHYSAQTDRHFDLVIMTEVVEHLPNMVEFIHAACRLLTQDGALLITTPNKSAHPKTAYWCTDNPPVHLWWLSEASMRQLAIQGGMRVEWCDWTGWNQGRVLGLPVPSPMLVEAIMPPYFDSDGSVLPHPHRRPTSVGLKRILAELLGEAQFDRIKRALQSPSASLRFYRRAALLEGGRSHTIGVAYRRFEAAVP